MREACLILKNHLNDDIKTLKSKEVVRSCMLLLTYHRVKHLTSPFHSIGIMQNHNYLKSLNALGVYFIVFFLALSFI